MLIYQISSKIIPLSYCRIEKFFIIFVLELFYAWDSVQIINLSAKFINDKFMAECQNTYAPYYYNKSINH